MRQAWTNAERELVGRLDALSRAYRLQNAVKWSFRAVMAGLVVDALVISAGRLGTDLPGTTTALLTLAPAVLVAAAVVGNMLSRPSHMTLAGHVDRALGLQERLTTAVELRDMAGQRLAGWQIADTLQQLRGRKGMRAFPIGIARREGALMVVAALGIAALTLLPAHVRPTDDRGRIAQAIKREADRLEQVAAATESAAASVGQRPAAAALRNATRGLGDSKGSPERAVAALAEASQELAGMSTSNVASLREALRRAASSLGSESTSGPKDANQAAAALSELAKRADSMSAAERASAARALRAAAESSGQFDPRLGASLRQAADAMAAGAPDASTALQRAADQAAKANQAIQQQEALDQAQAQIDQSRAAINSAARQSEVERGTGSPEASSPRGARDDRARQPSARGEDSSGHSDSGNQEGQDGSGAGKGHVDSSTQVFDPDAGTSHREHLGSDELENPTIRESSQMGTADAGTATVDYSDVYASYRDRAKAATQDRYVPLDMQQLVKDYFSSIDPEN